MSQSMILHDGCVDRFPGAYALGGILLEPVLVDSVLFDKKKEWVSEPLASDPLLDLVALLQ